MNQFKLKFKIAGWLKITRKEIKHVEEWANVLFVRFIKGSPRFVSKKALSFVPEVTPQPKQKSTKEQVKTFNPERLFYLFHKNDVRQALKTGNGLFAVEGLEVKAEQPLLGELKQQGLVAENNTLTFAGKKVWAKLAS